MADEQQQDKQFQIQRVYVKDLSFESPNSPMVFSQEWKPEINIGIDSKIGNMGNGLFELVLTVNVEAKQDDKTVFLVEVQQAGIFLLQGFEQNEVDQLLGIAAPNILFPYAREAVSDLVTKGSFPQLVLSPINFEAIYAQKMAEEQAATH